MKIINQLSNINFFRKPLISYTPVESFSREEAKKWVKNIPGGGIGGIEVFLDEQGISIQLMHHEIEDCREPSKQLSHFHPVTPLENVYCFQFYLKKPSFYSITQEDSKGWLQRIKSIKGEAWIQIVFQKDKHNKWRELFQQQYDDYLNGVTLPSNISIIRSLQLKIVKISDKFNISIPPIPSFEKRKEQPVFRFFIRGYIKGEELERDRFIQQLLTELNKEKGENEWGVICKKARRKEQIEKWSTLAAQYLTSIHPYIVESELASLLPCTAKTNRFVQPKKTRPKRINLFPIFKFLPSHDMQSEPLLLDQFEQELNGALEKLGLIKEQGLQIIGFEQGPTFIRLNILLPKGIRLSDLQKIISDWKTELGINDLSVFQGTEKGTGILTIPRKNRETVYLRNLVDTEEFGDFSKDKFLPFAVGTTETGEALYEDLARVKHLLVAGSTGSGKSVWLIQFILTLLIWVPTQQLMMYLIDPKRVEFPGFSTFNNVKVYTEIDEAKHLLQSLINLMESRYKQLEREGVRNIAQYNRKQKDAPMPYVVTVIDEFGDLMMQDPDGVVEECIVRLAQKARACGIHLVVATQRPSVDVVTGLIKANLPSRVIFKCSGRNDYHTVLDQKPPFNLLGAGDGACLMEGKTLARFQGPLIAKTEEEMDEIIETYGKNQIGIGPLLLEIISESEEEPPGPLDELKRYIALTGETRITHIRKHMKMRMNDVKDLMQVLVKEGWLEAPATRNSGYKLILSEKEREKFLIEK